MKNYKTLLYLLVLIGFLGVSCGDKMGLDPTLEGNLGMQGELVFDYPEIEISPPPSSDPIPLDRLQAYINREIALKGDFGWDMADDYTLWSAVVGGDSIIYLGYKAIGIDSIDYKTLDLKSEPWQNARAYTIGFILRELNTRYPEKGISEEDILVKEQKLIPLIQLKVYDYETIAKLRKLQTVRYVEPHGLKPESTSQLRSSETLGSINLGSGSGSGSGSSGCGSDCSTNCPRSSDYFTISPNSKVGWNVGAGNHNVASTTSSMWDHCPAGAGITIALIDTGIDPDNDLLDPNDQFATGLSAGRTQQRINMYDVGNEANDTDDQCGHGTRMAALLANPRNNVGGITGMAYRANLVVYRAGNGPAISFLLATVKDAVIDAYEDIAARADIDIISMSMGSNIKLRSINDAVESAYASGKLIFCAAGSGGIEVHPAKSAKVETIAVTGVSNNSPSHTNLTEAQKCGTGTYVDFSMFTEETIPSGTRYGLSTKMQQGDEITWSKQSSHATALCAGIAASVWSVDPNFSRAQVLGFLRTAASMGFNRDDDFGWGIVDGQSAVNNANLVANPLFAVTIAGPTLLNTYGQKTWTPQVSGASTANLSYSWQWETSSPTNGASYNYWYYPSGNTNFTYYTLTLSATEQGGLNRTASTSIQIYPDYPN
ncbi:MAG: S8 family serine peptidase [Bacteroidia bacterium]